MVMYCCAYGCKTKWMNGGSYTFHSFPKDVARSRQWLLKLRRANFSPTQHSKVCSKHFTEDCFDREKFGGTWLKADAVPTLFDFTPCVQERQKTTKAKKKPKKNVFRDKLTKSNDRLPKKVWYLEEFQKEDDISSPTILKKSSRNKKKKTAEKTDTTVPPFEPEIVIKEEPIDIDETQLPSTSRTADEFILPGPQTGWTPTPSSGHTPSLGVAFTVVKTEEDPSPANGKAGRHSEKVAEDDSSAKDRAKDHFDAYGEYIAAKLRKLDWKSCAHVQKAIGDIIFEAEMGKYK